MRSFRGCLKKLGESMQVLKDLDLLRYAEVFHQNTLRYVGRLRTVQCFCN
ncbi:hypothetical protein [Thauera sp. SDU_THAU2]